MKRLSILFLVYAFLVIFPPSAWTQGDVRSATGMPIPIGAAVIWGQIELRGLKPTITDQLLASLSWSMDPRSARLKQTTRDITISFSESGTAQACWFQLEEWRSGVS